MNVDDANIAAPSGNFEKETGLWDFEGVTKHKPLEMFHPELVIATEKRNDLVSSKTINRLTGKCMKMELKADVSQQCECGAGYEENGYKKQGNATLYTRMGPVECAYYNLECKAGRCTVHFTEQAKKEAIFFSSHMTCCGDEIGWDFISLVKTSKISFRGFCTEMTRRYKTNNCLATSFLSGSTFVKWFFSWLSAFQIDFRKEVDPFCKYDPQAFVCDGTHIGVSLANMKLSHPVTETDDHNTIRITQHKRYDRVIIPDHTARGHLRYLCHLHLGKLKPEEHLPEENLRLKNMEMLVIIENMGEEDLLNFITVFTNQEHDPQVITSMANLLYLLSGDCAMLSVLPSLSWPHVNACLQDVRCGSINHKNLLHLKEYTCETAHLISMAHKHDCVTLVASFITWVIDRIKLVHQYNHIKPAPEPMEGTYYPPGGTAYYFTESGQQLRKLPKYDCDSGFNKRTNYDEANIVDRQCNKDFPSVSMGGYGYMFLWFCGQHGHCYGFHLISGGEGWKDPFCSLYKYVKDMPKDVFL